MLTSISCSVNISRFILTHAHLFFGFELFGFNTHPLIKRSITLPCVLVLNLEDSRSFWAWRKTFSRLGWYRWDRRTQICQRCSKHKKCEYSRCKKFNSFSKKSFKKIFNDYLYLKESLISSTNLLRKCNFFLFQAILVRIRRVNLGEHSAKVDTVR